METQNLYKVTLRGMTTSSTGMIHGINYVVATDPTEAVVGAVATVKTPRLTGPENVV